MQGTINKCVYMTIIIAVTYLHYLWHADGYDKLSPYGSCIHGCIDGYELQIIYAYFHPTYTSSVVYHARYCG